MKGGRVRGRRRRRRRTRGFGGGAAKVIGRRGGVKGEVGGGEQRKRGQAGWRGTRLRRQIYII